MSGRSAASHQELLESLAASWARGEFWDAELYADDVVLVVSGPDPGEYQGLEGMGGAWRDFLSAWEDFRIETEQIVPGREGVYLILMRLHGRGKGSGMDIEAEVANVLTVRDGKVARLEMFWDREAALVAAGVPEEADR